MKILRVASDLYPAAVGGYGIHVHEMSRMQAERGHDVTVLTANMNGLPDEEWVDGYRVLRFNHSFKMVGNTISPTLFFRLMEMRHDYDVIHAHSHLFFPTNVCALVKKYRLGPARYHEPRDYVGLGSPLAQRRLHEHARPLDPERGRPGDLLYACRAEPARSPSSASTRTGLP